MMNIAKAPAVTLMRNLGLEPDPWQVEVLESTEPHILLNCCRQAGKSTVVALLALAEAIWVPGSKILLISRSLRQSTELYRFVTDFYLRLQEPICERRTKGELQLTNGSRIVCLPCKEETIRGFSSIKLLILDEAARIPDDLYRSVSPMLAVSRGRMICLSTPFGKRGFFYENWATGGEDWQRVEVPVTMIPRIDPAYVARERRLHGESWCQQEYMCSFESVSGLVYPDLPGCVTKSLAPALKKKVGGIDFGYRNPFAAVWGGLDRDGVLWLTGEHYCREQPLSYHVARLPRDVLWYCDPSGAAERAELRVAGFKINPGHNTIRPGIAAVQARIRSGTLKICHGACPNLMAEAGLYRYDEEAGKNNEQPIGEHDHALDALRYLISRLDQRRQALGRAADSPLTGETSPTAKPKNDLWLRYGNEALWTRIM
jgi:hypothetical protein